MKYKAIAMNPIPHKSLKYEICSICGRKWNVSNIEKNRYSSYICPYCDSKLKKW